jgi:hypothetical protein
MLTNPRSILQAEGLAALLVCISVYVSRGQSVVLFAALFFVPDIAYVGFAFSRIGGVTIYNLLHNFVLPTGLAAYGYIAKDPLAIDIALIWGAHIGFNRLIGVGMKAGETQWRAELREIGKPLAPSRS